MRASSRLALALCLCACALSLPAVAQSTEKQASENEARALELFEESDRLYKQGEFEAAAQKLEEAHALHPEPLLLYNLGRAREGMGDLQRAADAFDAYLAAVPNAPDRGAIEKRIATLRERLRRSAELEADRERARRELEQARRDEPPDSTEEPSILAGPLPWVLAGVGGAGIVVGAALGAAAQGKHEDAVAEPVQLEATELQATAEDLAVGSTVAFVIGGVLVAGGVTLGIIGLVGDSSDDTAWDLRVGPGWVGFGGSL